ncbi:MAG: hypothetical protein FJ222_08440 [Lentisphaerae bacterium]|nr:hypothetical protein [Lentisphaerota bacterium]
MKKLLGVVAVALISAATLAQELDGGWPRVYQYAASLNTAVAKNAKTVTYTDCEREMDIDVCYRVKGKVSIKGVIVFGCACVDEEEYNSLPDGYPIILMATSADNYRGSRSPKAMSGPPTGWAAPSPQRRRSPSWASTRPSEPGRRMPAPASATTSSGMPVSAQPDWSRAATAMTSRRSQAR